MAYQVEFYNDTSKPWQKGEEFPSWRAASSWAQAQDYEDYRIVRIDRNEPPTVKKVHVRGTNNRTLCGRKSNIDTQFITKDQEQYETTCDSCLGRVATDFKYMMSCLKDLQQYSSTIKVIKIISETKAANLEALKNFNLGGW